MSNDNSSPTVTNCTFTGNTSKTHGGGIYNYYSSPTVTNCILWGDEPNEICDDATSTTTVSYSDVEGGTGQSWFGTGCINADPLFVDPCNPDPNLRNFRVSPGSPCIDAADSNSVPADTVDLDNDGNTAEPIPYDLDGHPRFVDGDCNYTAIVDMGAFEFSCSYFGDFDSDCDIDFADFAILAKQWQLVRLSSDFGPDGGDGIVNFLDWATLASGWQDTTDIEDVAVFADQWLLCGAYCADIAPAPYGDGVVNMLDFAILAENWFLGVE